jgi:hypothetical protein
MQRVRTHLAVVVSATAKTDRLRCQLLDAGIPPGGITSHLRGLRRSLVLGEVDRVTLCIALDAHTLRRYGQDLRRLLDDQRSFASVITAIGLTLNEPLSAEAASLGCSVYLDDLDQAVEAVGYFEHCGTLRAPQRNVKGVTKHWTVSPADESDAWPADNGAQRVQRKRKTRRRSSDTVKDE